MWLMLLLKHDSHPLVYRSINPCPLLILTSSFYFIPSNRTYPAHLDKLWPNSKANEGVLYFPVVLICGDLLCSCSTKRPSSIIFCDTNVPECCVWQCFRNSFVPKFKILLSFCTVILTSSSTIRLRISWSSDLLLGSCSNFPWATGFPFVPFFRNILSGVSTDHLRHNDLHKTHMVNNCESAPSWVCI